MTLKNKEKKHFSANGLERLTRDLFQCAVSGATRAEFLKILSEKLLGFSGADMVGLCLQLGKDSSRIERAVLTREDFSYEICAPEESDPCLRGDAPGESAFPSAASIPIVIGSEPIGFLNFGSVQSGFFPEEKVLLLKAIAQSLGLCVLSQRSQAALHERIKELTCLYSIARASETPNSQLESVLQVIVEQLPAGWQYPEITRARIRLDDQPFISGKWENTGEELSADIVVAGKRRGVVQVAYIESCPALDEGPFLVEERNLIDAIASQVGRVIERHEAEAASRVLQEQLRHADRLATIGQLASGIAHELNEPLGNILGFAQLAQKNSDASVQLMKDLDMIVRASLSARKIIRNLLTFARQAPSNNTQFDLNALMDEAVSFFESRCQQESIRIVREYDPDLWEITADRGQIHQLLINLIVNAIQAMPSGGTLTLKTGGTREKVVFVVEDTGEGMNEETRKQVFLPFFTTKEVGKGTGLGLAVVYGIVSSHGGSITVESEARKGARFRVVLPVEGEGGASE